MDCNFKPCIVDGVQLIENRTLFGKVFYVLACEERDKYMKVPQNRVKYIEIAIKLFNGQIMMSEIMKLYPGVRFEQLYLQLKKAGFIEQYDIPSNEIDIMTKEIIAIRLEKFCINHKKVFSIYATIMERGYLFLFPLCLMILVFSGIDMQGLKIGFATYKDSVFGGVFMLFASSIIFTFLHELSHIAVAIKYGKYVEKISFNLYFGVLPMCFVKCKGLNTLKTSYKLHVVLAGVITNFMAAVISLTLLSMDIFGSHIESIFKLCFWGNIFSVFANLVPTSLSDGYFVLSILLGKYDMKMFIFKDLFTKNRKLSVRDFICYSVYFVFLIITVAVIVYSALIWINDLFVGINVNIRYIVMCVTILYLLSVFIGIMYKIFKIRGVYEK